MIYMIYIYIYRENDRGIVWYMVHMNRGRIWYNNPTIYEMQIYTKPWATMVHVDNHMWYKLAVW